MRFDFTSKTGLNPGLLVGAGQTTTELITEVVKVSVRGSSVIVRVTVIVDAGRVRIMVVPASVTVVVTGGTIEIDVSIRVVPGCVIVGPGAVTTVV